MLRRPYKDMLIKLSVELNIPIDILESKAEAFINWNHKGLTNEKLMNKLRDFYATHTYIVPRTGDCSRCNKTKRLYKIDNTDNPKWKGRYVCAKCHRTLGRWNKL